MRHMSESTTVVLTIGHSTHTLEAFIDLLQKYAVEEIVDVRTIPRSRHNPQFNVDTLPQELRAKSIDYVHMPGLGGLRRPKPDSANMGWRNASFRGFADYMQTQEFEKNLMTLINLAEQRQVSLMCAEAVPWRCHRFLIADALYIRGIQVKHILSLSVSIPHSMTAWADVKGTRITYPQRDSNRAPDTHQLRLDPQAADERQDI
jgi:uncharacterized protein (DUF488 family)